MALKYTLPTWLKRICSFSIVLSVCPVEVQDLNVTRGQFDSSEEMQKFFEILNECQHNQTEGLYVDKSMNAYANWINRMYYLQTDSNQKKLMKMQSKLEKICALYRDKEMLSSEIDDFYWEYYKTLSIPNRSMNCSIFGVNKFVEFVLLEQYKENKELNIKNEKLDILDIGCGIGLVGMSLIRSVNKLKINQHFELNIEGFDHSDIALQYGQNKKYWNYLNVYDKVWKQDLFDMVAERKYDVVFASDILYQLPVCGCVGVNAVKQSFKYVQNGGYLVIINPIQVSTPCIQESYERLLEEFYNENNIVCVLNGIVDTIDHDKDYQRLDAVYVHIRILYKGFDESIHGDHFCHVERPCVNLMK